MIVTREQVSKYVQDYWERISNAPGRAAKASLARLRRGIGKTLGAAPEVWGEFFGDMPEEFRIQAEWAVYIALTLFALHQQGREIQTERAHQKGKSLGAAAAELVWAEEANEGGHKMTEEEIEKNRERIWRRFYKVATADDMMELAYYLRGMVQLFKTNGISLDYARLAGDLYDFQFPERTDNVRLRWGEDFYRIRKTEGETDDGSESVS